MKISPPSSQSSQRLFSSQTQHTQGFPSILSGSLWLETEFTERRFPLRRSIREDFLPFSLALCALCGSKPSSHKSQRDCFPLRRSIRRDFLHFSLALCGSKPSSQRSPRDRFSSQTQHRRRFPSILSCSLWLKTEFTEVTERLFSSQTQRTRRFPSILPCSLCSLWLKY
jgi:hypothetical protein